MISSDFLRKLQHGFSSDLPGVHAHKIMSPINRLIDPLSDDERLNYRKSAVGILCFPYNNTIQFVLLQRPEYEGNHSAQISFPGGKREENDESLEHTARRETYEEIGVELTANNLLGQLSEIYIPISNFTIEPFVYFLESEPSILPDEREVASVHIISIDDLLNDENVKTMDMKLITGIKMKNVPYFLLNDKIVWGATAIMLSELKEMLR